MDLHVLQQQHAQWLAHNFPDQLHYEPLLGVTEEAGELSHAHLKFHQGIRGYDPETYLSEAGDAVGDIVIYLASYCTTNGLDLDKCVRDAWNEVRNRDWVKFPENGRDK